MRMNIDGVFGELTTLPGCSQLVVSHGVYVPESVRSKGIGTRANMKRQDVASDLGYDYMLCTVVSSNIAQVRVMEKTGWKLLDRFKSSRSDQDISIYGRTL